MNLLWAKILYVTTFNLIQLLFAHIERFFPDPLNQFYDPGQALRWPLAIITILFPVFLWLSKFLRRDIKANPEKNELRIRKWLLYLTLFLTASLIIGDLITLVFNFLNGDLTARFLLKVFTVLVIAGGIFWYYLRELRYAPDNLKPSARIFSWVAIVVVLISVIGGFFVAGSPFKQRLIRFDSQKISDLQEIQWQIINYWQQKGRIPTELNDLRDSISGFVPPTDPQSGKPYLYNVKKTAGPPEDALGPSFELCADFNLAESAFGVQRGVPSPVKYPPLGEGVAEVWSHPAGDFCFERTIDTELYPPHAAKQ